MASNNERNREPVRLGNVCGRCTLDSKCLNREFVCASRVQAWETFHCRQCNKRGFASTLLWEAGRQTRVYFWNPDSVIAQIQLRSRELGEDG